jgi:PHD/YefM family antitoxin component YafN of YafNO toxin-antitoxin module
VTITHQTVVDSQGKPAAALIPWAEFLLIREILESDEASSEEADALREAAADRRAGRLDAFADLASLKAELAL